MFFDLNIPISAPISLKYASNASKKKGKQKAPSVDQPDQPSADLFSQTHVEAVERRIDVLVHCEGSCSSQRARISYDNLLNSSGIHRPCTESKHPVFLLV